MASTEPGLARRERAALADLFVEVGPHAPTLCEGWDAADLATHLVVRDWAPPMAVAGAIPPLRGAAQRSNDRIRDRLGFDRTVERFRAGPPLYSPTRIGAIDGLVNDVEMFVHHEDVRRAQPEWEPRPMSPQDEFTLWRGLTRSSRMLGRQAKSGLLVVRTDTSEALQLRAGDPVTEVRGLPSELLLYLMGRREVAQVEVA